jgi:hypothetical protein
MTFPVCLSNCGYKDQLVGAMANLWLARIAPTAIHNVFSPDLFTPLSIEIPIFYTKQTFFP